MRSGSKITLKALALALAVLSSFGVAAFALAKTPLAFSNKLEGGFGTARRGNGMMALQTEVKGVTPSGLQILAEGSFLAEERIVEALRKGTLKEARVENGSLKATIAGNTILGRGSARLTRMPDETIRLEGRFTITGGTKKLANASGGATVSGVANLKKGTISLKLNGSVAVLGGDGRR